MRLLIAYDGSPAARSAIEAAGALFAPAGAEHLPDRRAIVACVWRSPVRHSVELELLSHLPAATVREFVADYDAAHEAAARRTAEEGAELAAALGMPAEPRVVESGSTPWRPLLRLASAEHATIIVTGAGRGELTAGLGSVATGLVHHAATAVLVVPEGAPVDEPAGTAQAAAGPGARGGGTTVTGQGES